MNVTVRLSSDGFRQAAEQLRRYAEQIEERNEELVSTLADDAVEIATLNCPVDTGGLVASIGAQKSGSYAEVTASGENVAFVEFGTGTGSAPSSATSNEAAAAVGWKRNASGRGEEGWPFVASDGNWKITHGQDGAGFMGAGADFAKSMVERRAREVFKR